MSADIRTTIYCDWPDCAGILPTRAEGKQEARMIARDFRGWGVRRNINEYGERQSFDYCPKHLAMGTGFTH